MPSPYTDETVYAMKALTAGTATAEQQKHALDWIIKTLAGTYEMSFRPDSERETDFQEGKRFVGLQIVKMINLPAALLKKERTR